MSQEFSTQKQTQKASTQHIILPTRNHLNVSKICLASGGFPQCFNIRHKYKNFFHIACVHQTRRKPLQSSLLPQMYAGVFISLFFSSSHFLYETHSFVFMLELCAIFGCSGKKSAALMKSRDKTEKLSRSSR